MTLSQNVIKIAEEIKKYPNAKLVAIVKNKPVEQIQQVIDAGAQILAFNKVQEAEEKFPQLRFGGQKHLIGHLQTNKVKKAITLFDVIQSVDSVKLAKKIDTEVKKQNMKEYKDKNTYSQKQKKYPILLQMNIAEDADKFGFSLSEAESNFLEIRSLKNISVRGMMTIGKRFSSNIDTQKIFQKLREFFENIKKKNIFGEDFVEISMGMSGDYNIALEEGATMVRVGGKLFL